MRWRDLIGLIGGAAALPLAASAQQRAAMPVVGFLGPAAEDAQRRYLVGFDGPEIQRCSAIFQVRRVRGRAHIWASSQAVETRDK